MTESGRQAKVLEILKSTGALLTDDHFVYASGRHGDAYVNKDALYLNPLEIGYLCGDIAQHFTIEGIEYDIVVGAEKGGIIIAQWVAYNSVSSREQGKVILAIFAERKERSLYKAVKRLGRLLGYIVEGISNANPIRELIHAGQELLVRSPKFEFRRGYDKLITGKRVLVVEDNLTTGGTVNNVVQAVRDAGGNVVGVGALCNRGDVTAEDVGGVPHLWSVLNLELQSWSEATCPLCKAGKPINEEFGKGREYIARNGQK